jgi:HTH-type transcriptional regulator/antitoxin HigA
VDYPGSFIEEELEARGWQQVDLAYILGMTPQQLSPLLKGKQKITPEMAIALGDAFDMPADFFANLQKQYDLQKAQPADPGVRARATWQSVFPVREMIRRGWIEETDTALLDVQMLRFFECNRIEDVPFVGSEAPAFAHAAYKSGDYKETTALQLAWLYRVRKIAQVMDAPVYSESKLREALPRIRAHMLDPNDAEKIPELLRNCGVRFVLVEALPRSKIDGVCLWLDDQPVIGMTTRFDRFDSFCFVLRHEIEHALNQDGREQMFAPIDEFESAEAMQPSDALPKEERLANEAAQDFCVPQSQLQSFIARKSPFISERDVIGFAARMEINPAVIVGQIQHKTKNYAWLRKYQVGVRKYLLEWPFTDGWGRAAETLL